MPQNAYTMKLVQKKIIIVKYGYKNIDYALYNLYANH